jgi:hypothetical protein
MSDVTQLTESVQRMSISGDSYGGGSHGAQAYVETGQGLEFQNPKYRVIPWSNKGEGDLTVQSGLFYLCMMAGYGSRHIDTGYPRLNTWWRYQAGGPFIDNTSGFYKKKLGSKDKLEDPDPAGQTVQVSEDHADYAEGSGTIVVDAGTAGMEEAQGHGGENEEAYVDEDEGAYLDDHEGAHVDDHGDDDNEETGAGDGQAYSGKGKEVARTGQSRVGESALPRLQVGNHMHLSNAVFTHPKGTSYLKSRSGERVARGCRSRRRNGIGWNMRVALFWHGRVRRRYM